MRTGAKVRWIAALADAGVREIETGSFAPPKLIPQMADTAEIATAVSQMPRLIVTALVPAFPPLSSHVRPMALT